MPEPGANSSEANVRVENRSDGFKPYPHQQAAWDAMTRRYGDDLWKSGLLVVPTGGGKTLIACRWLIQQHLRKAGRVLWLTHRRSLLRQAFSTFVAQAHLAAPKTSLHLTCVSSEDRSWTSVGPDHDVVFSSIQSAATTRALDCVDLFPRQSPNGLFVVIDEAHHAASRSYQEVVSRLKDAGARLMGLTATPVRMDDNDNRRLWSLFDRNLLFEVSKRELIERGILSRPAVETVRTHVEMERDFTDEELDHLKRFGEIGPTVLARLAEHASRNKLIVEHYVQNRERYGKTIVFAATTAHASTLAMEFRKAGVAADHVDYTRGDSASVMDAYRDQEEPQVLANVEMLTEGYDAPRTQTVFLARPTRSEALLSQMVGRALRGPAAGGTETANLVTFVDTWSEYDVLDAAYIVPKESADAEFASGGLRGELVTVSEQLIAEAYRMIQSVFRGTLEGVHGCLPYSWYVWEEETETDVNRRLLLVFENQVAGFERLMSELVTSKRLPFEITPAFAEAVRRDFFSDCPDPRPSVADLFAFLHAHRAGVPVAHYTFDEKRAFDPNVLAAEFRRDIPDERLAKLRGIYDSNPVCRLVYRSDFDTFREEVSDAIERLVAGAGRASLPAPLFVPLERSALRGWGDIADRYVLGSLWNDMVSQKRHFPSGLPAVSHVEFSSRPLSGVWGYYRHSDRTIVLSQTLDSPDIPRFVIEFLLYHETLHADLPGSGHNSAFRERERRFVPSPAAIQDAEARGIQVAAEPGAWRALSDQFLDSFHRRFMPGDETPMSFAVTY